MRNAWGLVLIPWQRLQQWSSHDRSVCENESPVLSTVVLTKNISRRTTVTTRSSANHTHDASTLVATLPSSFLFSSRRRGSSSSFSRRCRRSSRGSSSSFYRRQDILLGLVERLLTLDVWRLSSCLHHSIRRSKYRSRFPNPFDRHNAPPKQPGVWHTSRTFK